MKKTVRNNAALQVTEAFCLRCASTSQLVSGSLNPGLKVVHLPSLCVCLLGFNCMTIKLNLLIFARPI